MSSAISSGPQAGEAGAPAQDSATRAGGSSFYTAMRILPRAQRDAMFEVYSFCRAVDDIADSDDPPKQRLAGLAQWRADIDAIYAGQPPARLKRLAETARDFGLRREDFLAVIDGMEMDALEDIQAPDWQKLDLYCDRVASAVGRLSVRIFGMDAERGDTLAYHLGRALQLTNILRDIDEDADIRRLYLPSEALSAAGITVTEPRAVLTHPRLGDACAPLVERARKHFAEAHAIMESSPRATVRAPKVMGAVYGAILEGMVARGWAAPRERVRIGKPRLLWLVLRNAFL